MIAIRTNLAAQYRQTRGRWRWELLVVPLLGCILIMVVAWWWHVDATVAELNREFGQARQQEALLAEQLHAVNDRITLHRAQNTQRDAFLDYASRKVNWATALEGIFAAIPATVELHELALTTEGGAEVLRLSGRSIGPEPRLEADKCMLQVEHAVRAAGPAVRGMFAKLEDTAAGIQVNGTRNAAADFIMEFRRTEERNAN
jgi:Tfp pilus assembly protein PilN